MMLWRMTLGRPLWASLVTGLRAAAVIVISALLAWNTRHAVLDAAQDLGPQQWQRCCSHFEADQADLAAPSFG